MMKKGTYVFLALFVLLNCNLTKAQSGDKCNVQYNLFTGDYKTKNYTEAKTKLHWLLENCPKISVNIYKRGSKVATALKDNELVKKVYEMRLIHFPNNGVAKAHSDYATYLSKNKLGTEEEIFSILEKAYKVSPKDMSVKNIYKYFKGITQKYQDTEPQKVFDTYDDVMESVQEKLDGYSKKLAVLQQKDTTATLTDKEKKKLKIYTTNSNALGQVEGGLDFIISKISTCERLVPLYTKGFDKNQTNIAWLKRAITRMAKKQCKSDPLYEKIARAYANTSQSAESFNFLAGVLDRNGDSNGAIQMRKKAFDLEKDPYKKAILKYREALDASNSGRKAKARSLAYEALKYNPNYGKSYLLIASLYQKSANSCGSNEFEKRMVYVAALNKARKAQAIDPGCGAKRYIRSYSKNIPNSKLIFNSGIKPGSPYKIKCWIGETVRVPNL